MARKISLRSRNAATRPQTDRKETARFISLSSVKVIDDMPVDNCPEVESKKGEKWGKSCFFLYEIRVLREEKHERIL